MMQFGGGCVHEVYKIKIPNARRQQKSECIASQMHVFQCLILLESCVKKNFACLPIGQAYLDQFNCIALWDIVNEQLSQEFPFSIH